MKICLLRLNRAPRTPPRNSGWTPRHPEPVGGRASMRWWGGNGDASRPATWNDERLTCQRLQPRRGHRSLRDRVAGKAAPTGPGGTSTLTSPMTAALQRGCRPLDFRAARARVSWVIIESSRDGGTLIALSPTGCPAALRAVPGIMRKAAPGRLSCFTLLLFWIA